MSEEDPIRPRDTSGFGLPPTSAGIFFRRSRSRRSGSARNAPISAVLIASAVPASNEASSARIGALLSETPRSANSTMRMPRLTWLIIGTIAMSLPMAASEITAISGATS
ncbi:hypothetical protein EOW77_0031925 [Bradyrhizobium yuanmingense]|nr:hypothetical protein EOW77_0031925 [Bradyrhizobium yuanmingense]